MSRLIDVDAGRRLVEKQDLRLVRQRLGDQEAPLHPAGKRDDLAVLPAPQRQVLEHLFDVLGIRLFAEQSAAKRHRSPYRLECVGRQLLRHQTDHRAGGAVGLDDIVPADQTFLGRIDDPAYRADQRRLACAVRTQQREDFAAANLQVDVFQRLRPEA
jgi:uncharacterized protein YjhX (UPF0386 family)